MAARVSSRPSAVPSAFSLFSLKALIIISAFANLSIHDAVHALNTDSKHWSTSSR